MAYIGAGITRFNTADELTVTGTSEFGGNVSFGDNNITNVGSLQIDSIAGDADTNTNITFAGSDVITMTTAGSERMRIDASGNVGINNTSPQAPIHIIDGNGSVSGASYRTATPLVLENNSNTELQFFSNSSNDAQIRFGDGDSNFAGAIEYKHGSDAMLFYTAVTERMRITSSGLVGIGTAAPAHNVEIVATAAGSVNDSLQIRNNATSNGTGSRIRFINSTDANSDANGASIASVRNGNDNDLVFETENSEAMRIDHSGKVGIGTASPEANVEIKSSGLAELRIDGGAVSPSVGPLIRGQHNNTDAFYIGTSSVVLGASSGQDVVIYGADSSSGNIRFYAGASTETARIRAGGGITFNGDTAAANALDDYEEGDWTPTVIATGGSPSIGYASQVGKYVKIGKMVTVWCRITLNSISGGSGDAKIEGLPVITENTEAMRGNSHVMLDQLSNNRRTASIQADPNGTTLTLIRDSGSTPSHAALPFSDITASTDVRFQYSYRVP